MEDYHSQVTSVAVAILSEYHDLFGKQLPDQGAIDHQTLEEQKRLLNFELNSSGKYFAFKEQLKAKTPLCCFTSLLVLSRQFLSEELLLHGGNLECYSVLLQNPFVPPKLLQRAWGGPGFSSNGAGSRLLWSHTRRTFPVNRGRLQT